LIICFYGWKSIFFSLTIDWIWKLQVILQTTIPLNLQNKWFYWIRDFFLPLNPGNFSSCHSQLRRKLPIFFECIISIVRCVFPTDCFSLSLFLSHPLKENF
jgi:hypothetical protein